jgi:hypothetical protein
MPIISKRTQISRLRKIISLADLRYDTSVNIKLPVRSILHSLVRSEKFTEDVLARAYELLDTASHIGGEDFYVHAEKEYDEIIRNKKLLSVHIINIAKNHASKKVRKSSYKSKTILLRSLTTAVIAKLNEADQTGTLKIRKDAHTNLQGETNALYNLSHQLYKLESFLDGDDFSTYLKSSLLIKGEAGIGKTHLLCDFAREAMALGHPVYMFLGEEFSNGNNPLHVMASLTGGDQFMFEQINVEAGRLNKRALIVIDAVNEAETKFDWSILNQLKRYRNISFVISIRNGYEDVVLSESFIKTLQIHTHPGLDISSYDDVATFFAHYKVPLPEVPLIAPEFKNPLFIKIFCRTYSRTKTVRGHMGATTLFEDYIKKQTKQVLRKIGEPRGRSDIWKKVIKPFAVWMGENGKARILESKAQELIELEYPGKSKQLLQEMQRQWLISKTPHYTKGGKVHGYEYKFPYQKFSDHLIVRYLLDRNLDKQNPKKSFSPSSKLGAILKSDYPHYHLRYGLIEAMSIQIPERLTGLDLIDISPKEFRHSYLAIETFLNSLMWRSLKLGTDGPKYFNRDNILKYINNYILKTNDGFDKVLNTILYTASIEHHPLDANVLHNFFLKSNMPNRDAYWQDFMRNYYDDGAVIDRYIVWASSKLSRKIKSQVVTEQTAIVMSWFLASESRIIRDNATKAMVNLLDGKYAVIIKLLNRFLNVDDVYILERLYAIAYGCALRESSHHKIKLLAEFIYSKEFLNNQPTEHILIRDYARGVVEYYHQYDKSALFDKALYLPPYASKYPKKFPTEKTLKKLYRDSDDVKKDYYPVWGATMSEIDDFAKKAIDYNLEKFTNKRLDGSEPVSERYKLNEILAELKPADAKILRETQKTVSSLKWHGILGNKTESNKKQQLIIQQCVKFVRDELNLADEQIRLLRKYISDQKIGDNLRFDKGPGRRWIFNKVIKLGWTPALHGEHDRSLARYDYGRDETKPENTVRKYQFQALHQFLAIVADNFVMAEKEGPYVGPWQLSVRDIDPTLTLAKTHAAKKNSWWFKVQYKNWNPELDDVTWMDNIEDLPNFEDLIEVTSKSGKDWLTLESYYEWKQPLMHIPESKRYDYRHREVWVMLKSYIIHKKDIGLFLSWSNKQHFMGRWMPESHEFYNAFYREYPNQSSFTQLYTPYYGREDWQSRDNMPVSIMVTDDEYLKELNGSDSSVTDSIRIKLPSRPIYNGMNLRNTIVDGQFRDEKQNIVFTDPHILEPGPSSLLSSRKQFKDFLQNNNYELVWTILGEKQTLGGGIGRSDKWPGRFEFSAVYYFNLEKDKVEGRVTVNKFVKRN